jgi:stage III sporulation protein AG
MVFNMSEKTSNEKANEKTYKVKINEEKPAKNKSSDVFDLRTWKTLLKNPKVVQAVLLGVCGLVVLFFLSDMTSGVNNSSGGNQANIESSKSVEEYEKLLEQKLERAISAIDGVGELTIVVTLDSLSETVYADRGTGVRTVITPRVRGVAIICEGGGDIIVKQKIVELTSRVLGINTTRISVTN